MVNGEWKIMAIERAIFDLRSLSIFNAPCSIPSKGEVSPSLQTCGLTLPPLRGPCPRNTPVGGPWPPNPPKDGFTVAALLTVAAASLAEHEIETPHLDAELLLAHVRGTTRSILLAHSGDAVGEEERARYHAALARRAAGESVAVITGHKAFRYLDFTVTKDTLVPRPETETLVEAALEQIALKTAVAGTNVAVLDVCAGSGAVGLSLKHEAPATTVTLSDISGAALAVARQNSETLNLPAAIILSDLFANIDNEATFDLIVSNPPYIPSAEIAALSPDVRNEPRLALDGGNDGLALIRRVVRDAKARLNSGGCLLMEADPRLMPAIQHLLHEQGYHEVAIRKDLSGQDRVITARSQFSVKAFPGWIASSSANAASSQ
ncbi:MAG: peptide chain release factor N(5)-glutamine methyltransferase [Spirochaetaceae bacterium]|jgi:release factor glutamine methyltransferase|nr:peptide chain release factor N(5)-glutamine methyltransferase [Spirochaetaceae bacterium]